MVHSSSQARYRTWSDGFQGGQMCWVISKSICWLYGSRKPDLKTLIKICEILATTPDVILGIVEQDKDNTLIGRALSAL